MPVNDELGIRMKSNYEDRAKTSLLRRTPVAIRLDGKSFHTFTRGMKRPFDETLMLAMQRTTLCLCQNIQGCVLGYTQSDEITLILCDYQRLDTSAWFDYQVQKVCSIAASMATLYFNQEFSGLVNDLCTFPEQTEESQRYNEILRKAVRTGAMFDARAFNIPIEEVTNLIYWRQLDATRNSIQMVGQANFSHKDLQNKSCAAIQDMLFEQFGINWNDFPTACKRGACVVKKEFQNPDIDIKDGAYPISAWVIDTEIPIFKGDGREYIEKLIHF